MGSEFVIDYSIASIKEKDEMITYRSYTADMLKAIAEGLGAEVKSRYYNLIKKQPVQDDKTGDEIALDIITRAGLQVA